jgi:two-component sensor histidine kinase
MIEEGLVMRELQHRMANTLAILQANCRLELGGVADPELRERLRRHELRILRLSELHQFLSRGAGRGEIEAADYFRSLCDVLTRSILAPLALHCETFVGEGVLDAATCEWLGLIVAELVMNAAKHAFPERSDGRIRVEIYAPDGMAWCCTVADNGCGMRNAAAGGAGSRIVDALVQMLEGQIAIDTGPAGTAVTIRFPAPLLKQVPPPLTSRDDRVWTVAGKE